MRNPFQKKTNQDVWLKAGAGVGAALLAVVLAWLRRDDILEFLKGKTLAVLGEQEVGKTCLIDFLTTGSIPSEYEPNLYAREVLGRRFQLKELKLNIPPLKQLPGSAAERAQWKEVVNEAEVVLYLLRVDRLMASHKPTEDRVQKDISLIKKWLDKLEKEGKRKKYPLFIIGTHCDLTDPDFTTLPKDQTGSYVDKVRYMPIFQKIELLGGGGSKVRFVFGSLKTLDMTEDLVYQLFYQIKTHKDKKST